MEVHSPHTSLMTGPGGRGGVAGRSDGAETAGEENLTEAREGEGGFGWGDGLVAAAPAG